MTEKKRVLVLGTGWGAVNFLRNVDTSKFIIECISPNPYFLFQPLLPAVVGRALTPESVVTPITDLISPSISYIIDEATIIDTDKKIVALASGSLKSYDILIHAIGTTVNTFGIEGVEEHSFFLKQLEDAERLRHHVKSELNVCASEVAKDKNADVRKRLSFLFVGAGPTGVETLSEIGDMIVKDYPSLIPYITMRLIDMAPKILPAMKTESAHAVQKHLVEAFPKGMVKLHLNAALVKMSSGSVTVKTKENISGSGTRVINDESGMKTVEIDAGTVLWSSGITQRPQTKALMDIQKSLGCKAAPGIRVTPDMKAIGFNDVYVLGDCAFIEPRPLDSSGIPSVEAGIRYLQKPEISEFNPQVTLLNECLANNTFSSAKELFQKLDTSYRSTPPTAQAATQHGQYLANVFNNNQTMNNPYAFKYNNKGVLCYAGQMRAAMEIGSYTLTPQNRMTGILWRAMYIHLQPNMQKKFDVTRNFLMGK